MRGSGPASPLAVARPRQGAATVPGLARSQAPLPLCAPVRRGTRPTDWNNGVKRVLGGILAALEEAARAGSTPKPEALRADLAQVLESYSVVGFPLNFTWTDARPILDALDATDIHNSAGKELRFALAVHVAAYPNAVYSVWVYVAALTSLR